MAPSALTPILNPTLNTSLPTFKIASIPGDGIGPEVISAGITVLEKLAKETGTFELQVEHLDWNSERYKKEGKYLPDDALEVLRGKDAILFGAVGAPGEFSFLFGRRGLK
jgi:isocitrate/isopropylmalate dehydrogenase